MDNLEFCVDALQGAMMLGKQAIQIEIAVCFVVFLQHDGDTGIKATKELRQVYHEAGRADCLTSDSPSYKTVNRRMGRCADLYEALGHRKIKKAVSGLSGKELIEALKKFIKPLDIGSMDDVAAHAGKPRPPAEPKQVAQDRRATDAPGVIHVKTRHIDLPVPPDVPKTELIALAKKLMRLAEKM